MEIFQYEMLDFQCLLLLVYFNAEILKAPTDHSRVTSKSHNEDEHTEEKYA